MRAPRLGFEPRTLKLTASCSTVELSRNIPLLNPQLFKGYGLFYHQIPRKSRRIHVRRACPLSHILVQLALVIELGHLKNQYFILRHGQSEANAAGVIASGRRAVRSFGLTPHGIEQVITTAQQALQQELFAPDTLIFTSPMLRARQTAERFADGVGVSRDNIRMLLDLRERHFGIFEGADAKHYGEDVWPYDPPYPYQRLDVESTEQVRRRMLRVIERMEQRYSGRRIVFVGHGDPFQILETAFAGEEPDMYSGLHRSLSHLENAQLVPLSKASNP